MRRHMHVHLKGLNTVHSMVYLQGRSSRHHDEHHHPDTPRRPARVCLRIREEPPATRETLQGDPLEDTLHSAESGAQKCTVCHPADCAVHRGRAGNELRVTDCLHLNYTRKGAVCVVREVQGLKLEQLQLRAWQTRGLAESRKHSRAS